MTSDPKADIPQNSGHDSEEGDEISLKKRVTKEYREDQQPEESKAKSHPNDNEDDTSEEEEEEEEEEDQSQADEDSYSIVETSPKGRFKRFNEELGAGAYKSVYRGIDEDTGREIAWNVIKINRLPKLDRKRISEEIHTLKSMKEHSNIIHFISAWINKSKEEVVFITEMVTAGSIRQYLKRIKRPRLKVLKTWAIQILEGLMYLHELNPPIIHRDIKCDNIFINSNKGEIRIGDLGLSTSLNHSFTTSVLGTPEFMAPELYEEKYGVSVDIYAFGM
jgi:WNK lysine deficient protein kinase